jgi:hypothetical protein
MMLNHNDGMVLIDGGSAAGFYCVKEGIWETVPNMSVGSIKQKKTSIIKHHKSGKYYAITDIRHDNGEATNQAGTRYTYIFNNRYCGYVPNPVDGIDGGTLSDIDISNMSNNLDASETK